MTAAPPNKAPMPTAAVWYGAALPVTDVTALVALAMLLEAALVREARSELRLEAAEPVAVASDLLSSEDLEAMSERTDEETEETAGEIEDETLLSSEDLEAMSELTDEETDEPAEAAEEVTEETSLAMEETTELTTLVSVVVSWAAAMEKSPARTVTKGVKRMMTVLFLLLVLLCFLSWERYFTWET